MKENLYKIESFFKYNLKVKEYMMEIGPKEEYIINEKKYRLLMLKTVKIMKSLIIIMIKQVGLDEYKKVVEPKFEGMIDLLYQNLSFEELKQFYTKYISNMSEQLIEDVNNEIKGYYLLKKTNILNDCNSINEIVHFLHSYLINNEDIYQSMPILNKKENIVLYGKNNQLAKTIYNSISVDSSVIDILSLDKKVLVMLRDIGHATTLEIENDNDTVIVKYFIPKICNREMVEKLQGLDKITDQYAKGIFEIVTQDVGTYLNDFINKIPTDIDMRYDNKKKTLF